mmetsp:Transcript_68434/g.161013  ORF Transcript_68434/g.161013 Transcript_68434/m.161013 type:complete len:220 (-) Transcript_68434:98-757(-)
MGSTASNLRHPEVVGGTSCHDIQLRDCQAQLSHIITTHVGWPGAFPLVDVLGSLSVLRLLLSNHHLGKVPIHVHGHLHPSQVIFLPDDQSSHPTRHLPAHLLFTVGSPKIHSRKNFNHEIQLAIQLLQWEVHPDIIGRSLVDLPTKHVASLGIGIASFGDASSGDLIQGRAHQWGSAADAMPTSSHEPDATDFANAGLFVDEVVGLQLQSQVAQTRKRV